MPPSMWTWLQGVGGLVLSLRRGGGMGDHRPWRDGPVGWQCLHHWPHNRDGSSGGQPSIDHTSGRSPSPPRYPAMHPTIKPIRESTTGPILCFHHFLTHNQVAGAQETTSSGSIELQCSFLCFCLASYCNRLCNWILSMPVHYVET